MQVGANSRTVVFGYGFYSDLVLVQGSGNLFPLGTRIHCWPTPVEYVYNSVTLRYGEIDTDNFGNTRVGYKVVATLL